MKVLYITGWTRSGSTLLDTLLGELEGFFSAGELISLWRMGILREHLCGCGRKLSSCPVWAPVLTSLYGEPERWPQSAAPIVALRDQVVQLRNLRKLLHPTSSKRWRDLEDYRAALAGVYGSVADQIGPQVVVNSSKLPHQAAAEMEVPGIEFFVVHLVRDPRAVAFSMLRRTMLQPDPDDPVEMPRAGVIASTAGWVRANMGAEMVRRKVAKDRSMLVRYEDLARDPRSVLSSIARFVDQPFVGLDLDRGSEAKLNGNHTVWGNSFRFKQGRTRIRLDEEWKSAMPLRQRTLATAVALPLLKRYRYPVNPGAT